MTTQTQKKLISTNSHTFYGKDESGKEKALVISFLQTNLKVSLHNALAEPTANSKFDYKTGTAVYLKPKKAKMLAKTLSKFRKSDNSSAPCAIASGTSLIEVRDVNGLPTIRIYSDIDSNKCTNNIESFVFSEDSYIINYDNKYGTFESESSSEDIDMLIEALVEYSKASSNAVAHTVKVETDYTAATMSRNMLQIMQKLGIAPTTNGGFAKGSQSPNWGDNSQPSSPKMSTDDLMRELEGL